MKPNCHLEEAYRMMRKSDESLIKNDFAGAAKLLELAAVNFDASGSDNNAKMCRATAATLR
jgi:hypothetical protein